MQLSSNLDRKLFNLLSDIQADANTDLYWRKRLDNIINNKEKAPNIHLGVFIQPYLNFLLDGQKTIESRFSVNRQAPFQVAQEDDILLIKASGGPLVGICRIAYTYYYHLDEETWGEIKQFSEALCIEDPAFWQQKSKASYASLLKIDNVVSLTPFSFPKRDRRGWVVLHKSHNT